MESPTESNTAAKAALVTAGIIAGAGVATLAALWFTRRGPFSGRELSLSSMLDRCDEAARNLERHFPLSA